MRIMRKGHLPSGQNFEQYISLSVFLEGEIICSNKDLLQFLDGGSGQRIRGFGKSKIGRFEQRGLEKSRSS